MYKVQKKDGSLEDFDRNKLIGSLLKSGCSNEESGKIASDIEAWLPTAAEKGTIKSLDIRTKVLEFLKTANPTAYTNFVSYKKPA